MPKDNRINLRFSDDEIIELEEKADGKPLASFCRESVLRIRKPQRKNRLSIHQCLAKLRGIYPLSVII